MDVNGTKLHLVFGRSDWESLGTGRGVVWDPRRGAVVLASVAERVEAPVPSGAEPDVRRGAGVDPFGHVYWVADDRRRIFFAPGANTKPQQLWPRVEGGASRDRVVALADTIDDDGDFRPLAARPEASIELGGLAVTTDRHLVVGTTEAPGLLVFDLDAGGPPTWYRWPDGLGFVPFDLAPRPNGGVVVLDRRAGAWARLWVLDARFAVVPWSADHVLRPAEIESFRPAGDASAPVTPAVTFPSGTALELTVALDGPRTIAVEVLPDDSVLVLEDDGAASTLRRFVHGVEVGAPIELDDALTPLGLTGARAAIEAQDLAFVGTSERGTVRGTLHLASADGRQVFTAALTVSGSGPMRLDFEPRYQPLRLSGRRALVAAAGAVLYDRNDERWLPVTSVPRPRYVASGVLPGRVFDGREPGCVWHRLFFDGCVPPGTSVSFEARADDDDARLASRSWVPQPRPYRRSLGSELPFTEPRAATEGSGTFELLFQRIEGRFLEVRVSFGGTGRATPMISALRVHYPRFSYLERYLPAIYREEETSASFVDRFLANAEGTSTELEGRIANAQVLFDPTAVPAEWLDWLASWMGVVFEPSWDEPRRRLFLKNAHRFHRMRGTIGGLSALLRLATDPCPTDAIFDGPSCTQARGARILEHFFVRTRAGREAFEPEGEVSSDVRRWRPADGVDALDARWRAWIEGTYSTVAALASSWGSAPATFADLTFSAVTPARAEKARDWRSFVDAEVDAVWAEVAASDVDRYRRFLRERHGAVETYRGVHGGAAASFDEIQLPAEDTFPRGTGALADWIDFVSRVLPIRSTAHRFTVLVPALPDEPDPVLMDRLSRVRAVVERERPAHTSFDVKLFWDLFRVGMVRVGVDTELGPGARFFPLVLDRRHLAEVFLDTEHPWHVTDRRIVGRDPIHVLHPAGDLGGTT
ncbi:phage tail protein [Myxococcota bacterium]|nr:phage tail protein [Myxococcota bacterium]